MLLHIQSERLKYVDGTARSFAGYSYFFIVGNDLYKTLLHRMRTQRYVFLENTNSGELIDFEQCHWFCKSMNVHNRFTGGYIWHVLAVMQVRSPPRSLARRLSDLLVVRGRALTGQVTPAVNLVTIDDENHVITYLIWPLFQRRPVISVEMSESYL